MDTVTPRYGVRCAGTMIPTRHARYAGMPCGMAAWNRETNPTKEPCKVALSNEAIHKFAKFYPIVQPPSKG